MPTPPIRLRDLRIGRRLAIAFLLCGLFVISGAYLGLSAQADGADKQAEIDRVVGASQIADDLLININDITGWQGLYLADIPAFGLEQALDEESYNRKGYLASRDTIRELFATVDTSELSGEERKILQRAEDDFEQLFAADDDIVALLERRGTAAFPRIMRSINGGEAGQAWEATYAEMGLLRTSMEERIADLRAERRDMAAAGYVRVYVSLGLAVLAAVAVIVVVTRSIVRPLRQSVAALEQVAAGRLDERLEDPSKDEIGQLARALDSALGTIGGALGELDRTALALADGSDRLARVSEEMSSSAAESSSQAERVSSGADQVSGNVQSVAAGTEEMSASIREIAQQATQAAGVAAQAVQAAESTTSTVTRLGDSSQEIGNVVKVITTIAEQTNLLALNATIEAARAGEAGKGFAVVANEVKELSHETGRATEDISRRIEAIQTDSQAAVAAIAEIAEIIGQINDSQLTIAAAVEEQTATTDEMSRSVHDAAEGSRDIAANIGGVADSASTTRAAAHSTSEEAGEFAALAQQVRDLVGRFQH